MAKILKLLYSFNALIESIIATAVNHAEIITLQPTTSRSPRVYLSSDRRFGFRQFMMVMAINTPITVM
jgi:hypothetical protein